MNKEDFINAVAKKANMSKKDTKKAVDAVCETIAETLAANDKVNLIGFGMFLRKERAARRGRNPSTGEEINIPETTVPIFKPGKSLRDAVIN